MICEKGTYFCCLFKPNVKCIYLNKFYTIKKSTKQLPCIIHT